MERLSGELVAGYASLFVQCWGQYAVQQGDGSYWRVTETAFVTVVGCTPGGEMDAGDVPVR